MVKSLLFSLIIFVLFGSTQIFAQGFGFHGSFTTYDYDSEQAVLNKIESDTDPETERIIMDCVALKFEYMSNTMSYVDGYMMMPVYFTDDEKQWYLFEYYLEDAEVVKIVLRARKNEQVNKQIYPEKADEDQIQE